MPLPRTFVAPHCVAGRFLIAARTERYIGEQRDYDFEILSEKPYPTFEACNDAIDLLQGRALARAA
jgi:hypothetical protein